MKRQITSLGFAVALILAGADASSARAEINNNPTPGSGTGEGEAACLQWCQTHNKKQMSIDKCVAQCERYWCKNGKCGFQDPIAPARRAAPSNGAGPTAPPPPKQAPKKIQ